MFFKIFTRNKEEVTPEIEVNVLPRTSKITEEQVLIDNIVAVRLRPQPRYQIEDIGGRLIETYYAESYVINDANQCVFKPLDYSLIHPLVLEYYVVKELPTT